MVEREACFLSIYLSLILHRVRSKMTSYSKTATTIYLYDVPRSIAEDPRIAFLQSNKFWQVSCAKSKTKACTEISAWTSQGARFLKIDLAQLSSQKRFDLRNS